MMEGSRRTGRLSDSLSRDRVLILDGAMGTELDRRQVDTSLPLWSASALMQSPGVVVNVHADYIAAGADIITTNTFRTTRRTFDRAGLRDRSLELTQLAVDLAQQARRRSGAEHVLIAGSIAPLEDCYRPDLVPSDSELEDEHGELALRLAAAGVDLIILETMNTAREALIACTQACATGLEVIVSFICRDAQTLLSGESLSTAVNTLQSAGPVAFSVNCVHPTVVAGVLGTMRESTSHPLCAYANVGVRGGESESRPMTTQVEPSAYSTHACQWLSGGVRIIGGCCGTTPDHIRHLRKNLLA